MASDVAAVLDASAMIALLWEEPGSEAVEPLLGRAAISAANVSEVLQRYRAVGVDPSGKLGDILALGIDVLPFDREDAEVAASLWESTRSAGLSLADRACLALAIRLEVPAHTADSAWSLVDVGAEVALIR